MSNDRQALDRAIERLENSINWLQHGRDAGKLLALEDMKALHAALASPAGEAVQEQPNTEQDDFAVPPVEPAAAQSADKGSLPVAQGLLLEWLAYVTESAGWTAELVADKEAFGEFMDDIEQQKQSLIERTRAALGQVQEQPQPVQPCAWCQDGDDESDTWATSCGEYFIVSDGKPSENDMRFCCYCGKHLVEHPMEFEDDEDGIGQLGDTGTKP